MNQFNFEVMALLQKQCHQIKKITHNYENINTYHYNANVFIHGYNKKETV